LRAVGVKDGQVVCVEELVTAGEPARIALEIDRETVAADARDVAHVTVSVLYGDGHLVPTADNEVSFQVEGHGRLIGVDNGDPASHESFQAPHRRAFNGLCLAIVQATGDPGKIRVTASSPGLRGEAVTITTVGG